MESPLEKVAAAVNDWQHYIFVNSLEFPNSPDEAADTLFFTVDVNEAELETALKKKGCSFIEIYAIPASDIGYYIYEPVYLTKKMEEAIINLNS